MMKYRNKPTRGYASAKEAKRAQELKLLERAGKIFGLNEQVTFQIIPPQKGERAAHYIADFTYHDPRGNEYHLVVEDVKGQKSGAAYQMFVLKRKLMLQVYGIRIKEV